MKRLKAHIAKLLSTMAPSILEQKPKRPLQPDKQVLDKESGEHKKKAAVIVAILANF